MNTKKMIGYIKNFGTALFACCFAVSFIKYGTIHGNQYSQTISYLIILAFCCIMVEYIYKLFHFKEYRKENIMNIAFLVIMLILIGIFTAVK